MGTEEKDMDRFLDLPSGARHHVLGWVFILIAIAALLAIGLRQYDVLSGISGLELTTYFRQGHSLRPGSKVLIAAVQVGEVSEVRLLYDPSADSDRIRVRVRMLIKGEYAYSIPENTTAVIHFGALDFANAIVLITPDSLTTLRLTNGAVIASRQSTDIVEDAKSAIAEVSRDLRAVVANLKILSSDVADSDGAYNRFMRSLLVSSSHAERILGRSRAAFDDRQSMAGVLLNENGVAVREITTSLRAVERTAGKLETLTDSMTREMDTMTVIAGHVRTASARLPGLINRADSTLVTIDRTSVRVGNSWLFNATSRPADARSLRPGQGN